MGWTIMDVCNLKMVFGNLEKNGMNVLLVVRVEKSGLSI
jgi:hypothetical protein